MLTVKIRQGQDMNRALQKFKALAIEEGIFKEEKEAYGDCRTKAEDLYQSHLTLFEADHPVFINVCGKKIWSSVEPQLLKDYF